MSRLPQSTPLVIFSRAFDTYNNAAIEVQIKNNRRYFSQEHASNNKSFIVYPNKKLKLQKTVTARNNEWNRIKTNKKRSYVPWDLSRQSGHPYPQGTRLTYIWPHNFQLESFSSLKINEQQDIKINCNENWKSISTKLSLIYGFNIITTIGGM